MKVKEKIVTTSAINKNRVYDEDQRFIMSRRQIVMPSVVLEHNHSLSPGKARYITLNEKWIPMSKGN